MDSEFMREMLHITTFLNVAATVYYYRRFVPVCIHAHVIAVLTDMAINSNSGSFVKDNKLYSVNMFNGAIPADTREIQLSKGEAFWMYIFLRWVSAILVVFTKHIYDASLLWFSRVYYSWLFCVYLVGYTFVFVYYPSLPFDDPTFIYSKDEGYAVCVMVLVSTMTLYWTQFEFFKLKYFNNKLLELTLTEAKCRCTECCICMTYERNVVLACGHTTCSKCYGELMKSGAVCPHCRSVVTREAQRFLLN